MTLRVRAIFEKGVFRPVDSVVLEEGTAGEVYFSPQAPMASSEQVVKALEAIANMPLQSPDDGYSGADHDEILYPRECHG